MMTARQRVHNALYGKEIDRIPWSPLIDDYYLAYLHSLGKKVNTIECQREIGADIIERHAPYYRCEFTGGVEQKHKTVGDTFYTEFITPVGRLTQAGKNIDNSFTITEFFVKSLEDIKTLQYIEEHKTSIPEYDWFTQKDAMIGDDGIATVTTPATPMSQLHEFYMGLENFVYFLEDYPEEMHELMAVMHANSIKDHIIAAQSPAQAVFMYEDTSTTTISRNMYLKYCQAEIDDYAKAVQDQGKVYYVHMCGKLKGFADMIADNKMDGIDSLCPPETGDMWPWAAHKHWKGKMILGGVDPTWLCLSSKEQVEAQIRETIEKAKPCRNTILCTGDATAYGTPLENLQLVAELVKKYGWH